MVSMIRLLAAGGLLAMVVAFPAAAEWHPEQAAEVSTSDVFQQRKDVEEIAIPQPPSGPATPIPFCSPGSPVCP
jgi:hypothetical protein